MSADDFDYLLSDDGIQLAVTALSLVEARRDPMSAILALRKAATPERARSIWELSLLRSRARKKFGELASRMYFTRNGLEMASGVVPAGYHAQKLLSSGVDRVLDLCGGIGGDALAFARAGLQVTVVESDALHARMAAANIHSLGFDSSVRVIVGDSSNPELLMGLMDGRPAEWAVWFDPARRTAGKRSVEPEEHMPPLSLIHTVLRLGAQYAGIKLGPGVDLNVAQEYGADLELLSHDGECKEALLWIGFTAGKARMTRAIVLAGGMFNVLEGVMDSGHREAYGWGASYILEPDPAVIRAHLVGTLADQLSARFIDPHIAYLAAMEPVFTPFADCYPVLEEFAYGRREVQRIVDRHNVSRLIVKKRGLTLDPEEVVKHVRFRNGPERILIVTRTEDRKVAYLCAAPVGSPEVLPQ